MTKNNEVDETAALKAARAQVEELEGTRAIMERGAQLHAAALATSKEERKFKLEVWRHVVDLGVGSLSIKTIERPQGSPLLWPSGYYISRNERTGMPWEVRVLLLGHGARDFRNYAEDERGVMLLDIAKWFVKYDLPVFEIQEGTSAAPPLEDKRVPPNDDIIIFEDDHRIERAVDALLADYGIESTPEARAAAHAAYWKWMKEAARCLLEYADWWARGPKGIAQGDFEFDETQF